MNQMTIERTLYTTYNLYRSDCVDRDEENLDPEDPEDLEILNKSTEEKNKNWWEDYIMFIEDGCGDVEYDENSINMILTNYSEWDIKLDNKYNGR